MKKPQIRNIIPHIVQSEHPTPLSDRIAHLHVQVIENRLYKLELTTEQKLTVIDQIIDNMKRREVHSVVTK